VSLAIPDMNVMWLFIILCTIAIAAVWFGVVPPPHASTLVRVRAGSVRVTRGKIRPEAKGQVAEILADAGIANGFIAVTPGERVAFSWNIPGTVHQRLRNVLLNQWT